jgi:hypothetical protein
MKLFWFREANGEFILRDLNKAARALLQPHPSGFGFVAVIIEPGLPDKRFGDHVEAAQWVETWLKENIFPDLELINHVPPDMPVFQHRAPAKKSRDTRQLELPFP